MAWALLLSPAYRANLDCFGSPLWPDRARCPSRDHHITLHSLARIPGSTQPRREADAATPFWKLHQARTTPGQEEFVQICNARRIMVGTVVAWKRPCGYGEEEVSLGTVVLNPPPIRRLLKRWKVSLGSISRFHRATVLR